MWLTFGGGSNRIVLATMVISYLKLTACVANSNFNASLRDYSVKDDINATKEIRTLQREDYTQYTNFAPMRAPVQYKEVQDNAISSSSYSHGLSHQEHPGGYSLQGYEESPTYGHVEQASYKHIGHAPDFDHHDGEHGYEHHGYGLGPHYGGHGHYVHGGHGHHFGPGYGHHHKHYDHHALTAKAILLPVAGLAILGAAAALVSNPVLLQLGVVSGRKRRDTDEVLSDETYDPDFNADNVRKWTKDYDSNEDKVVERIHSGLKRKPSEIKYKKPLFRLPVKSLKQSPIEMVTLGEHRQGDRILRENFVPVPLQLRHVDE